MFRFSSRPSNKSDQESKWIHFLAAETKAEIISQATNSDPLYFNHADKKNEYNFEGLSLLEIASAKGKLLHVRTYLEEKNPSQNDVLKSFFRALEAQQNEVALLLLAHENTLAAVSEKTLVKSSPLVTERHADYLLKIGKSNHYPFRFNNNAYKGNIALIIAAGLSDSILFNQLLEYPEIAEQLADSGITAFLSATLDETAGVKTNINSDIAFKLLTIPAVKRFAESCTNDYAALLTKFSEYPKNLKALNHKVESEKAIPTHESFTSVAEYKSDNSLSSLDLGQGSSLRFTSVIDSLRSASSRSTSVMIDMDDENNNGCDSDDQSISPPPYF